MSVFGFLGMASGKLKYNLNIIKIMETALCPKCGYPLSKSEVEGYDYQCLACDEDFYSIEVIESTLCLMFNY